MTQDVYEVRAADEVEAARETLSTYHGRMFLWAMMQAAGYEQSSFAGEETHTSAFCEGRKSVAEWGKNWAFTVGPEIYSMMRREALERERRYESVEDGAAEF